jgi:hypothetical protein
VVVVPSQGSSGRGIVYDLEPKDRPIAYTKTPESPNLGMYGSSEDITGGMGLEGVLELQRFVAAGGVLVTLGNATTLPTDFGLARSISGSRPTGNVYAPRPIVEGEVTHLEHPVFYGYDGKTLPLKYATNPVYWWQNHGEFNMLFNALMTWDDLGAGAGK